MTETLYAKDFESFSLPLNQLDPMSDSNDSFPMSPFTQSPPSGYSSELINSPEELFGAQPYLEQPPQQTQQLETKVFVVQQQTTQQAPNFLTASSQQTQQPYTTTTTTNFVFQSQTKLPTLPLLQNQQPQQQQQSQTQTPPKPTFIVLPELPQLQHSVPAGSSPEQSPQNLPLTSQIQKHKKIKKRKHDETSPVSDGHVGVSSTFPSSTPITESNFKELSAQQMLELDSNQIEDYIRILSNRKNVTATEDKELKKIRRLIKNREYAQSSRDKKKQHMDEVESRMNDAMSEMKELKDENVVLKRNMNLVADAAQRDPELANRLRILAPTLDLSCGGFSKSMNNSSSSSSSGHHVYSVPDISSFVPQAGAINLPHQNNFPSISASNTSTTKSKGATAKSSSNASKRVKTSVGVVSLFVVALAFGMFVNNLSSLPPRASIVNSGASNWRTGRVILSVEKWYHSYAPTFMHPYLDTLFTLFDNDIDEHSNEFHSTTTTTTSAKLSTQESRTINNNNGQHNTISTSNNVGSGNEPSNRLRVESDGVVEAKNNAAASRGDL